MLFEIAGGKDQLPAEKLGGKRAPTVKQRIATFRSATAFVIKTTGRVDQADLFKAASTSSNRFAGIGFVGKVPTLRFLQLLRSHGRNRWYKP